MIELIADKIKVTGPKADHSYTLSFEMGEHMQLQICKAMVLPTDKNIILKVNIATEEDINRISEGKWKK